MIKKFSTFRGYAGLLFFCCLNIFGSPGIIYALAFADSKYDSLKQLIGSAQKNELSGHLNALSEMFLEAGQYDSALVYASRASEEAASSNQIRNRAQAEKNRAEAYYYLNAYSESISAYEQAITLYEQIGLYEESAYCYNVIGILYRKQFNYKKAMEYALTSLRIAQAHNLGIRKSSALYNIAKIHHAVSQLDQAIDYYRQSLKEDEILGDTLGMAKGYCNLGICYRAKNDTQEALHAYRLSHHLYSAIRDTEGIALILNNMGVLFLKTGRYKEALDSLRRAVIFFESIHDVEGQAYAWNSIGDVYYQLGQTAKALDANYYALGMTRETDLRKNIYESLSLIYASLGQYKKAYEYHQKLLAVNDSIMNRENTQQLAEIQVRYETEKKEQEISYLKMLNDRQRDLQIWMASGLIFVSFFAGMLFISRKRIANHRKQLGQINSCFLAFGPDPHKNIGNLTELFRKMTGAEYSVYLRSIIKGYELVAGDCVPQDFPSSLPYHPPGLPPTAEIADGNIRLVDQGPNSAVIPSSRAYQSWSYCPVKYDGAYRGLLVSVFRKKKIFSREERKITGILSAAVGSEEERRIAEEALQSSERRYHDLFDHSLGFIGLHDLKGYLQIVNPAAARSLGYTPDDMKGHHVTEFLSPSMKRLFPSYLDQITSNGLFSGMMRVQTKEGHSRIWIFHNICYHETGQDPFILSHALDITDLIITRKEREKLIHELQRALAKVKTLSGLLPICASCKKIRDDKGYWNQIENYLAVHSDAEFSHGMCPDCQRRLYPELFTEEE